MTDNAGDLLQALRVKKFVITPKEDGSIEVFIAGAGRRIESTTCTAEFVSAIIEGYQYTILKEEVSGRLYSNDCFTAGLAILSRLRRDSPGES